MDEIPFQVRFNMMVVDCQEIKSHLLKCCKDIEEALLRSISEHILQTKQDLVTRITEIITRIRMSADQAHELVELE